MKALTKTAALAGAVLLVATACSSDDSSGTTTSTTATTTTTEEAATTTTTATTTTNAPTTTTTTVPPGPPAPLSFLDLTSTGPFWGLYAYGGEDLSTPAAWVAFVNIGNYLGLAGVSPASSYYSFGEFGCDPPSAETFGVDPSWLTISMYFETEADATAALAAFPGSDPPLGIAEISLFCAD